MAPLSPTCRFYYLCVRDAIRGLRLGHDRAEERCNLVSVLSSVKEVDYESVFRNNLGLILENSIGKHITQYE